MKRFLLLAKKPLIAVSDLKTPGNFNKLFIKLFGEIQLTIR